MPGKKAGWLTTNLERIAVRGGPAAARESANDEPASTTASQNVPSPGGGRSGPVMRLLLGSSVIEEGHPAGGDIVHAAHERDRAVVEVLRHVRASLSDGSNRLAHVLLGHLRDAAGVFRVAAVGRLDRGMDLGQQAGEVTELHAVDRALDCAAARVPEHHDELRADLDRVFEAPELIIVHDVAAHAHGEDVADPLVEDDLDGRA